MTSKMQNYLYTGAAIIIALIVGRLINAVLGGLPGSLYGMVIFALALHFNVIKAEKVKDGIRWVIANMGVCFVPAGVGTINYLPFLQQHWLIILSMVVVTTLMLMTLVGKLAQKFVSAKSMGQL